MDMISSWNEWDSLKRVVVGDATHANWPVYDRVFRAEEEKTLWKDTPLPSGPVPQWIIDETNEDLHQLCDTFNKLGIEVVRPNSMNFQAHDGLYNYCPRDRLLVLGSTVVDTAMMYPCRDMEYQCYIDILEDADRIISMPRNKGLVLDAANILRLGENKLLYLESASGNKLAYYWLLSNLPPTTSIELCNFYSGVHIDSTIVPLREGLVLLNGSRVNGGNCPRVFADWEKIYVDDVVPQEFYQYPYASKWIALNMLSVDPQTVILDKRQHTLSSILEKKGFTVIPLELRHSRTLGGGFHCVTLDLVRTAK
jgi:glycine amidinotransferase/scyllo-inosamine-4-phosphate amidinotransferase 1